MRLRGEHNKENIAAALAVSKILNISEKVTHEVIRGFRGLEHRLEEVKTVDGVTYTRIHSLPRPKQQLQQ